MVRRYHTIKPCKIAMNGNIVKTRLKKERTDRGTLIVADLDQHTAIGLEPGIGLTRNDAIWREAIGPAIKRQTGIEITDFCGECLDDPGGDVRRVGDDEVEPGSTPTPNPPHEGE